MVDATLTDTRQDDAVTRRGELPAQVAAPSAPAMPRPLVVLWFGIVIAVGAFLAFGSVRVGAGNLIGRRMSVRKIWSRFVGFLVEEGSSAALVIAVSAAAIFALIVAAVVLWLAFALRDAPRDATPADANER